MQKVLAHPFIKKNFNFFHQLASSYGAIVINIAIFAFLTPYMLNTLGKEQYGVWQLVSNIAMYFSMSSFGLSSSFYLEFNKHRNDQLMMQKLINSVFFAYLFVSLISLSAFVFILIKFDSLFIVSAGFLMKSKLTFVFSYLAFLVTFIFGFLDLIVYLNNRITTKNITEILRISANGLGSILLIYLGFDIVAIAILSLVVTICQTLFFYKTSQKFHSFRLKFSYFDFNYIRSIYKGGLYYFLYSLSVIVIMNTDNILISHFMGAAAVSVYAVIFRLVTISEKFIFVITTVKGPKVSQFIAEKRFDSVFDIYKKVWLVTALLSVGVAIFISLFGVSILQLWLGDRFEYDVVLIYIFSIFIVFHTLSSTTAWFIGGLGIMKHQSIVSLIELIANILLSVLLFHSYGLRGIALGTLVSHIFISSWYPTWYLIKELKQRSNNNKI